MLLRLGILFILVHVALISLAQRDTTMLEPVTVYGIPEEKYLAGSHIESADSLLAKSFQSSNLGEYLSFQFPVYFRTYGSGMISGISMRGTSPSHTAVLWNGININSLSLGQADFSILPAVAFDEVKLHSGGGSARFGSGAFGGAVLLNSDAGQKPLVDVNLEAGSFGRYFGSMKISSEVGRFAFSASAYRVQSENDFPLRGGHRQQQAAFAQQGFVQHLQYNLSPVRSISLDYWLHDSDREVQPTMSKNSDGTSPDTQQDRNHRLVVSYQQNSSSGYLKGGAGIVDDRIVFNGSPSNIFRWLAYVNHQILLFKKWNFQSSINWDHIIGKVEEYHHEPQEDRIDIAASLQRDFDRVRLSLNLRQPFITNVSAPLLPYVGVDLIMFRINESEVLLSANASRNFRAPTFNDRYWESAGSRELLPETSYAAEGGFSFVRRKTTLRASSFYQLIDQWIQWVPDFKGVFRPRNVVKVRISGIEGSAQTTWAAGKFSQRIKATYQYTRSTMLESPPGEEASIGKQLIYVPFHTASGFMFSEWKGWTTGVMVQFQGRRFFESSNASGYSLDPFMLTDVTFGKKIPVHRHLMSFMFSARNIFDVDYQLYAGRALPGRNYNLQFVYQLNHKISIK